MVWEPQDLDAFLVYSQMTRRRRGSSLPKVAWRTPHSLEPGLKNTGPPPDPRGPGAMGI